MTLGMDAFLLLLWFSTSFLKLWGLSPELSLFVLFDNINILVATVQKKDVGPTKNVRMKELTDSSTETIIGWDSFLCLIGHRDHKKLSKNMAL